MFNEILYRPIFNALVLLYEYASWQDLGIAIILLTIIIRIILFPLFHVAMRQQYAMQRLQPHVKKIQNDHKDSREKQAQALMALYKQHGVNPFSGILLMLAQLPIFLALFWVFRDGITIESLGQLYSFVSPPEEITHSFFGLIDLQGRSIILVGVAAIAQYFQGRLTLTPQSERIAKQMVMLGPALTVAIMSFLPAAIALYWLASSTFSIFQQVIIMKSIKNDEQQPPANSKTA
ncbi:hypothetical protein A3A20_02685 [Candidatus Wolfebacteria bacterium RIFCSPLOWO2_01_FULL_45_19]|uniref:Membrane insertase YidC/Oxa/ALB C-terminal domain-containing protein n=1 Tax=Candidatus Wolfebacteria bacterium RIFCSPLOWO2_01_FULL_45_19 TaxID=1802557 RepID=A0A1F8DS79_9BACT|nr:MAG: Sporulation associated-membrane protein [Parcubacteria group bacterium GW2011_GWB1_45_9]OGM91454.1 MAG: hypothetical protein A3A20_02685 [Candidatus Wolfebacteria bacterium RIFCSPLOWO2_01_FULL_45_19]